MRHRCGSEPAYTPLARDALQLDELFGVGGLARGIGPAQVRREDDLDIAADGIAHLRPEFQGIDAPAQHVELVHRLRALIARVQDACGERVGLRRPVAAEPHVLRADGDLDRLARLDARRQPGGELLSRGRLDDAELLLALQDAALDQVRDAGEVRDEQVGGLL